MNRRAACLALVGAGSALAMAACTPPAPGLQAAGPLLLAGGAAAMLPLTRALARSFARMHGAAGMLVEPGGSLPAYIAASRGAIDIAAMTRALSDGEDDARAHHYLIARDHIVIVVNRAMPVTDLAQAQIRALLAGEITNWRTVGGPDLPVSVHAPAGGGLARQCTEQVLLDGGDFAVDAREYADDAALAAAIEAAPGAIGCLQGHARAGIERAAALAVDGVADTRATVLSGRYPYTQGFHLLLHGEPDGVRGAFIRFARSAAGQAIVAAHGYVSVC